MKTIFNSFALLAAPHSGGWSAPRPGDKKAWKDLPALQLYNLEPTRAKPTTSRLNTLKSSGA